MTDYGVGTAAGITVASAPYANTILLNPNAYFSPTKAPFIDAGGATTKDLLLNDAAKFGLDYPRLSIEDWQAMTILHELGHLNGGLDDDTGNPHQSEVNQGRIVENCFPDLKR